VVGVVGTSRYSRTGMAPAGRVRCISPIGRSVTSGPWKVPIKAVMEVRGVEVFGGSAKAEPDTEARMAVSLAEKCMTAN